MNNSFRSKFIGLASLGLVTLLFFNNVDSMVARLVSATPTTLIATDLYLPVIIESMANPSTPTPTPTPVPMFEGQNSNPNYYPFHIFDAEPPEVDIPTLQQLIPTPESDQEIIDQVLAYYEENAERLQVGWRETNPDRVKAFLAMYIIHISHIYGNDEKPYDTFVKYLTERTRSDCSLYARYQSRLLDGFGLKWRHVAMSSGFHGWIEVEIDGHWEIFDSTSNVWIDQSAFDLLAGESRSYRLFYTPWTDINRPDARDVLEEYDPEVNGQPHPFYYTPGTLRPNMPGIGIYFFTETYQQNSGVKLEIWGESTPPSK